MNAIKHAFAATVLAVAAVPASATTVVTFEGVPDQVLINDYYNGGIAANGSSGPNIGVAFTNFSSYVGAGSPSSTIAYNSAAVATSTFAAGFQSLNFLYGFFGTGTISVFSGLNGTGSLLSTRTFAADIASLDNAFSAGSVAFSGTAKSFTLASAVGNAGLDDVTFGTSAVPEPATWGLMITGLGMIGGTVRRRKQKAAVAYA
ncbi:PEPxxWA-CTERM sorting domain-containing protein [Sphingomonas sp. CARO-RG-8B-R24-01]|uniref:PEPxxWA-CTERM sorting domain-containing protein n=1 Tax=Sphingomonas sp. CARO-RG-8B-R24-01 TaxID=2914831 RepID=UPI001F561856|nr:PEPxxWA-CTERM sorting domain-containing protein [Sphingomonas sp. CARO-RG-8B-R24-01]